MIYYSKGKIAAIDPIKQGVSANGKEWKRTSMVLDVDIAEGQQPTKQIFGAFGEKVDALLNYGVGAHVEVGWIMFAREYQGKLYTNVDMLTITGLDAPSAPANTQREAPKVVKPQPKVSSDELDPSKHEDDLPF